MSIKKDSKWRTCARIECMIKELGRNRMFLLWNFCWD